MLDANIDARELSPGRSRRNLLRAGVRLGAGVTAFAAVGLKSAPVLAIDSHGCNDHSAPNNPNCCFLRGTLIRTGTGHARIEDLEPGDLVWTEFGGLQPIVWVSRNTYVRQEASRAWVEDVRPVRVARGALAPDVPSSDLYLTANHAVRVDDVLVPVGSLINGVNIVRDDAASFERLDYFHIKLASHDVVEANGAPCESLQGLNEYAANFAEYSRNENAALVVQESCLPVVGFAGGRSEVASYLRSAISPLVDIRSKFDILRDRIDDRAFAVERTGAL